MSLKIYRFIHIILTGLITIPITIFMAEGAIGETYGEMVEPEFLILIAIWFVGVVLIFIKKTFTYGLIISSLPTALFVAVILYSVISGILL